MPGNTDPAESFVRRSPELVAEAFNLVAAIRHLHTAAVRYNEAHSQAHASRQAYNFARRQLIFAAMAARYLGLCTWVVQHYASLDSLHLVLRHNVVALNEGEVDCVHYTLTTWCTEHVQGEHGTMEHWDALQQTITARCPSLLRVELNDGVLAVKTSQGWDPLPDIFRCHFAVGRLQDYGRGPADDVPQEWNIPPLLAGIELRNEVEADPQRRRYEEVLLARDFVSEVAPRT